MTDKIYLPDDEKKKAEVIEKLIKEHGSVTLEKDNGNTIAHVEPKPKKNENIHPVTGKPVLLD